MISHISLGPVSSLTGFLLVTLLCVTRIVVNRLDYRHIEGFVQDSSISSTIVAWRWAMPPEWHSKIYITRTKITRWCTTLEWHSKISITRTKITWWCTTLEWHNRGHSVFCRMSMASCKTAVSPLLTHWRYCSLALSLRCLGNVIDWRQFS